jgi:hypothetical protein
MSKPDRPREGWHLTTIATEANRDSKRTNEGGHFLVGSLGLSCRYKRYLFCLGYSSRPSTKYFFLTVHYFNSFVPIAQQAGQAAVLGRLSLTVVCVSDQTLNKMCVLEEIPLCVIIYRWFGRSPENMKSELHNLSSLDSVSGKLSKRLNY